MNNRENWSHSEEEALKMEEKKRERAALAQLAEDTGDSSLKEEVLATEEEEREKAATDQLVTDMGSEDAAMAELTEDRNESSAKHDEKAREVAAMNQMTSEDDEISLKAEAAAAEQEKAELLEREIAELKNVAEDFSRDLQNLARAVGDREAEGLNQILGNEDEFLGKTRYLAFDLTDNPAEEDKNKQKGDLVEKLRQAFKLLESTTENGFRRRESGMRENSDSLETLIRCYAYAAETLEKIPYSLRVSDLQDADQTVRVLQDAVQILAHKRDAVNGY